jgi:hypothetical protein
VRGGLAVGAAVLTLLLVGLAAPAAAASAPVAPDGPPATATLQPPPADTPTPDTGNPSPPIPGGGASNLSSGFAPLGQEQANGLFDGFLVHGFERFVDGVRESLQHFVDDANLVTNTSPTWTYQQQTVVALQRAVLLATTAAFGLAVFWMGLNALLRPHLGGGYPELHELIPRLVLAAGLATSAPHWTALAIDVNDQVCAWLLTIDSGSPGDLFRSMPTFDRTWLLALLLVGFLLVWIWLLLKMAARIAMLQVLLVLAPAAQLCWALPQTRGMADRWHARFWPTVWAQVVVTVSLKLAWGFAGTAAGNPVSPLITLCLLFLAANSPELLASGVSRIGLTALMEVALLAARTMALTSGGGAGAAVAGAAGTLAGDASAAGGAAGGVAAEAAPRVRATPNTVSGISGSTGGGQAVGDKAAGFGRGGRRPGGGSAATNKGQDLGGQEDRASA